MMVSSYLLINFLILPCYIFIKLPLCSFIPNTSPKSKLILFMVSFRHEPFVFSAFFLPIWSTSKGSCGCNRGKSSSHKYY